MSGRVAPLLPALAATALLAACQAGGTGGLSGGGGDQAVTLAPHLAGQPSGLFILRTGESAGHYRFENGLVHFEKFGCDQVASPAAVNGPPAILAIRCDQSESLYLMRFAWDGEILTKEQGTTSVWRDEAGRASYVTRLTLVDRFAISGGTCAFLDRRYTSVQQNADGSVTDHADDSTAADNKDQVSCTVREWRA